MNKTDVDVSCSTCRYSDRNVEVCDLFDELILVDYLCPYYHGGD